MSTNDIPSKSVLPSSSSESGWGNVRFPSKPHEHTMDRPTNFPLQPENRHTLYFIILTVEFLCVFGLLGLHIFDNLKFKKEISSTIFTVQNKINKAEQSGFEVSQFRPKVTRQSKELEKVETLIMFGRLQEVRNNVLDIQKELDAYYSDTVPNKKRVLQAASLKLDTTIAERSYFDYPSKNSVTSLSQSVRNTLNDPNATLLEVNQYIQDCDTQSEVIVREVNQIKRSILVNNVNTLSQEANALYAFYSQRKGYEEELKAIQSYKDRAADIVSDKYKDVSVDALTKIAETEIFPLLTKPREKKVAVEVKEHKEWLEQQHRNMLAHGIPLPPIDAPKLIVVDVNDQRLYAYENGISIFDLPVPVTTGKRGYDTVRGSFSIYLKASPWRMRSPFPNDPYDSMVTYWMPFFQGYGLHDAYWRSVYGTQDYGAVGSHGCVNIPFATVQKLFFWAEIGTPVIVR